MRRSRLPAEVGCEHDDAITIPGPDGAAARIDEVETVAAEPIEVRWRRDGPGRDRLVDRPDDDRAGVFYPAGADSAEERLHYYASTFPVVEVDATYYALPAPRTAELWVDRTPPDFTFDIKAHALMTGQGTETKRLPKVIRDELPDDLRAKPRIYAKDLPAELRTPSGRCSATGSLRSRPRPARFDPAPVSDVGLPVVGEPGAIEDAVERLDGWRARSSSATGRGSTRRTPSGRCASSPTASIAVRHGRRAAGFQEQRAAASPRSPRRTSPSSGSTAATPTTWEAKGITPAERFRYLYSRDELVGVGPADPRGRDRGARDPVLMNNCYANYGTTNAREIAHLLDDLDA